MKQQHSKLTKAQLVSQISTAFSGFQLEEGIGLWEAQAIDLQQSDVERSVNRKRDEKYDWNKIPLIDLYHCHSSLSFFDAKGFRFYLPKFLLFAIDFYEKEEEELFKSGTIDASETPEVGFALSAVLAYLEAKDEYQRKMLEYYTQKYALLTQAQIRCIISFFEYRITEIDEFYNSEYCIQKGIKPSQHSQKTIEEYQQAIHYWTQKTTD